MPATNTQGATAAVTPATPAPGAPAVSSLPTPVTATDWAYAILLGLGITPNANNLQALIAQMHVEDNTLTYLTARNNPLAVTNPGGTPIPGNSAGVQQYSNWLTGLAATVTDIKANPAMLAALQNNSSCQQYGGALAKSNWEGGGAGNANNPGYGASVAASCNASAVASNSASDAFGQALANSNLGPNIISQLGNPALAVAGGVASLSSLETKFLGDLTSAVWWKRVGIFAGGGALFVIGLVGFLSTTNEGKKVISEGKSAAEVAAVA